MVLSLDDGAGEGVICGLGSDEEVGIGLELPKGMTNWTSSHEVVLVPASERRKLTC